ncbi:MAG: hypothetical protein NT062_27940, partial [Proteobacteria bacterium]|nr:hypothetical protein [Pseudomonadota bacterium]
TASAGCQIEDADLAEDAITEFTIAPAAMTTDRFSMHYTGTVTAGFTSARPATLTINVAGQPVVSQSIDLSTQLTQPVDVVVPLSAEGPNAVSAELTYQGATLAEDSVITVAITAPSITIPTFAQAYTAHVGLSATGKVLVTAAAGYTVDAVATSVDSGPWQPTTSDGAGGWDATLVDPDIGDVDVAVRAQVWIDGHAGTLTSHATMHVNPVFDCEAQASMLPSSTLLVTGQNSQGTGENRVMVGYFGKPGLHDATFTIAGNANAFQGNPLITVVSQTVSSTSTEVHVAFNTNQLRCDTGNQTTCNTSYNLAAIVDGVQLCATTGGGAGTYYGVVKRLF